MNGTGEGSTEMCCERLLCAACSSPVSDGRCATCRSARAELHHHRGGLSYEMLAALVLLVTVLMLVAQRY